MSIHPCRKTALTQQEPECCDLQQTESSPETETAAESISNEDGTESVEKEDVDNCDAEALDCAETDKGSEEECCTVRNELQVV